MTVANVLETLFARTQVQPGTSLNSLHYTLHAGDDDTSDRYTLRITTGLALFTHEYAAAIVRASVRVLSVDIMPTKHLIDIIIARAAASPAPKRHSYVPVKRRRRVAIDYDAGDVAADDRKTLDSIVDDVYASIDRVPEDMGFWYESIRDGSGTAVTSEDDASESCTGGARLGFALCFTNVPRVTSAFLEHVTTAHTATVASAYVFLEPPARVAPSPLLVINVRAADTSVSKTKSAIRNNVPRGLGVPLEEPASKRRRE